MKHLVVCLLLLLTVAACTDGDSMRRRSSSLWTLYAMKQMQMCASMRFSVKWNIGLV